MEELLLTFAAASGPLARGAEEESNGTPKTGGIGEVTHHDCGGLAVNFKKMSSRLSSPNVERSSSREPLATTSAPDATDDAGLLAPQFEGN